MIPVTLTSRLIAGGLLLLLILAVVIGGPAACSKIRSMGAQAKVDHAQSGAFVNSAGDAVQTIGNASGRERASDDLTANNTKEIQNAPGANVQVDPAVAAAGRNSLCRRAAYRDSSQCQLHHAPAK